MVAVQPRALHGNGQDRPDKTGSVAVRFVHDYLAVP
jgi:hypothetical protein